MIYIKLKKCCFFFFEVYFEAPKMYTNQLNNICNEVARELNICSFTRDMLLYQYFSIFFFSNLWQICRLDVFCKRGVLRNFTKLTRKQLRRLQLYCKSLWHRYFPVNFMKFLRAPIFIEHLWWLLLNCTEMAKYTCGLKHKI